MINVSKKKYRKAYIMDDSVGVVWTNSQRSCVVCGWDTFTAAYDKGKLVGLCADKTCREKVMKEV